VGFQRGPGDVGTAGRRDQDSSWDGKVSHLPGGTCSLGTGTRKSVPFPKRLENLSDQSGEKNKGIAY
jgi:hypothetical protein